MKSLFTLLILVGTSAHATNYECKSQNYRNDTGINRSATQFSFKMFALNGTVDIIDLTGSIKDKSGMVANDGSTLNFSEKRISNDKKYKPRKYKNSLRFILDSDHKQVYSVYGYLVIDRKISKKGVAAARYIFQADQNGGTIDLTCQTDAK